MRSQLKALGGSPQEEKALLPMSGFGMTTFVGACPSHGTEHYSSVTLQPQPADNLPTALSTKV